MSTPKRRVAIASLSAVVLTVAGAVVMSASLQAPGPVTRLAVGGNDTIVVNNQRTMHVPARALDAKGNEVPVTGIRYEWLSGDSMTISSDGNLTCTRNADATIALSHKPEKASAVHARIFVRCRPVKRLQLAGPMQLIVGDSAQTVQFLATGLDDKPVDMIAGSLTTMRDSIVNLEPGLKIRAIAAGGSLTTMYVGDLNQRVGVHTYDRVSDIADLERHYRAVMLPLSLAPGEVKRWPLRSGIYMLTMLPYEEEHTGLRLRVEGANCVPLQITARRIACETTGPAYVVVSHPSSTTGARLTGELLLDPERK